MRSRFLLLPPLAIVALAIAACGDGPDPVPTPTATAGPGDFGPAPTLDGRITAISPGHGEVVTQASTRRGPVGVPSGVCFEANLDGINSLWFLMAVGGELVVEKGIWYARDQAATEGTFCYDPEEGLPVGIHQVAVSVQDPNNFNAPAQELIGWAFQVTE
jgi:hypothetical protein